MICILLTQLTLTCSLYYCHAIYESLFAAGYTIDEIAKATMEMKELRQLRADSLKTQGMMTGAILALLSGAAETTGSTVKAVTILPNAIAGAGKAMVNGTTTAITGAGAGMMGLTEKVVMGTTNAARMTGSAVTGAATQGIQGTGKVMVGTADLIVKGTTGVVTGTGKVLAGTGKVGIDVVKGTGKVGMDVVKGTGNVMVGSTKAVVKGTGVLFSGTAGVMKASTKRLSRMVSAGGTMDSSAHSSSDHNDMDSSDRSFMRPSIFNNFGKGIPKPQRISTPTKSLAATASTPPIPKPTNLTRQRSLDSARAAETETGSKAQLNDELLEMQDFLTQLEGMDKKTVTKIVYEEQEKKRKNRVTSLLPSSSHHKSPDEGKSRGLSMFSPLGGAKFVGFGKQNSNLDDSSSSHC